MTEKKKRTERAVVRAYGDELRDAHYDYSHGLGRYPAEVLYNILRDYLISRGYDIPPYKGKGGANLSMEQLEKAAANMRIKQSKKPHFIPMGKELLYKYNRDLQRDSDDIEVKRLTVEDIARVNEIDIDDLKVYFQKRAILSYDLRIVNVLRSIFGCSIEDLLKEVK